MPKQMYQAIVQINGQSAPLGYTDNKDELLMYYEHTGIQLENIRFIPIEFKD